MTTIIDSLIRAVFYSIFALIFVVAFTALGVLNITSPGHAYAICLVSCLFFEFVLYYATVIITNKLAQAKK